MPTSPPRQRHLDLGLPSMPRRQSCDRCHEQKVRCVTEGPNGSTSLEGIVEEADSNPGGAVVSSVPCVRCRKAGAVCIYSRIDIEMGIAEYPQEPTYDSGVQKTAYLSSPHAIASAQWQETIQRNFGVDAPPLTEQWHAPSYYSDGTPRMRTTCEMASFATAPAIPCAPIFPQPATGMVLTTGHDPGAYSWGFPSSPEGLLEELLQINLRVHLGGRALPEPSITLAPWSFPPVNDVLDAACSLIDVVDRFAAARPMASLRPVELGPGSTIDTAFDASTCLMVQACQQSVLGVLEHISAWLLLYMTKSSQHQTPPKTPPPPTVLSNCHPQAAAMTNLIIHILTELDRAFMILSRNAHALRHQGDIVTPGPMTALGHGLPNSRIARATTIGGHWEPPDLQPGHNAWQGNTAALSLFSDVKERRARVREQMKAVQGLLS
ncbi:hypothetical protein C7999DRAFT_17452 [Corynascus novoguineensis]|uniref:Zn(2)-C6 fungal-type domain-containing protein n=1 Tax=Corynascus novoguineensis TaxID=1126955 RepID=A0AAN7HJE2_9PEZI|nr:hypothetical protein C7999DRAFT_17452 [Corynascus novoguineensis]